MYTGAVRKCQLSALEEQTRYRSALHHNVQPVAIYSNMTHFHVSHFDDVITYSNGETGDSKLTGA